MAKAESGSHGGIKDMFAKIGSRFHPHDVSTPQAGGSKAAERNASKRVQHVISRNLTEPHFKLEMSTGSKSHPQHAQHSYVDIQQSASQNATRNIDHAPMKSSIPSHDKGPRESLTRVTQPSTSASGKGADMHVPVPSIGTTSRKISDCESSVSKVTAKPLTANICYMESRNNVRQDVIGTHVARLSIAEEKTKRPPPESASRFIKGKLALPLADHEHTDSHAHTPLVTKLKEKVHHLTSHDGSVHPPSFSQSRCEACISRQEAGENQV